VLAERHTVPVKCIMVMAEDDCYNAWDSLSLAKSGVHIK
jgi:hypothetical protein